MALDEESLQVLSCNIEARPRDAAGVEQVLPYLRRVKTAVDAVTFDFDPSGKAVVESFVAAERLCCTALTWTITGSDDHVQLIVGGTPDQVAVVSQWFGV